MAKPDPLPLYRPGFCQGCQQFVERLVLVSPAGRYRCDTCAGKERA